MDSPCIALVVWTSCRDRWKSRGNWKALSVSLITSQVIEPVSLSPFAEEWSCLTFKLWESTTYTHAILHLYTYVSNGGLIFDLPLSYNMLRCSTLANLSVIPSHLKAWNCSCQSTSGWIYPRELRHCASSEPNHQAMYLSRNSSFFTTGEGQRCCNLRGKKAQHNTVWGHANKKQKNTLIIYNSEWVRCNLKLQK